MKTIYNPGPAIDSFAHAGHQLSIPSGLSEQTELVAGRLVVAYGSIGENAGLCIVPDASHVPAVQDTCDKCGRSAMVQPGPAELAKVAQAAIENAKAVYADKTKKTAAAGVVTIPPMAAEVNSPPMAAHD